MQMPMKLIRKLGSSILKAEWLIIQHSRLAIPVTKADNCYSAIQELQ